MHKLSMTTRIMPSAARVSGVNTLPMPTLVVLALFPEGPRPT